MTRYFAWAPLLIAGLAVSYAIVERLLGEPCPGEQIERVVGHVVMAIFALYFLLGYWLAVTRGYLALAIATLWAWQLLVIAPVLAPACGGLTRQGLWFEPAGLGFLVFIAFIVILGIATSVAMYRCYRVGADLDRATRRARILWLLGCTALLVVLMTAGTHIAAPKYQAMYASFGTDLPAPTLALLAGYPYAWLACLPFIAAFLYATARTWPGDGQLRAGLNIAIGVLAGVNVLASALMFAAYAPMLKLCGCV